jgi:hypothetical protein
VRRGAKPTDLRANEVAGLPNGGGRAAIVASIEPVVAGMLGVTLLGEELTVLKALLVLAGALLAQIRLGKARPRSGPA